MQDHPHTGLTARTFSDANAAGYSSSNIEGLFDIPPKAGRRNPDQAGDGTCEGILATELELAAELQDCGPEVTQESIDEYKQIQNTGCPQYCEDGCPVIVCPSLYSLDCDGLTREAEIEDELKRHLDHFNPLKMDEMVQEAVRERILGGVHVDVSNVDDATQGASKFAARAFKEAGYFVASSGVGNSTDVSQLLLMSVLETCDKILGSETAKEDGATEDFTLMELHAIWDDGVSRAMGILKPQIPSSCDVPEEMVETFMRKLMESTNRTFLSLMSNPWFHKLLTEYGTKGCAEAIKAERENTNAAAGFDFPVSQSAEYVRKVAAKFLEGVIVEAGHLIG